MHMFGYLRKSILIQLLFIRVSVIRFLLTQKIFCYVDLDFGSDFFGLDLDSGIPNMFAQGTNDWDVPELINLISVLKILGGRSRPNTNKIKYFFEA